MRALFSTLIIAIIFCIMPTAHATISYNELLARPRPSPTHTLKYGSDPSQFGELWLPKRPGPYPVIVLIHGGCWQASLPGLDLMTYLAEDLQRNGVAVWNVEYRRLYFQGSGYPIVFSDIAGSIDILSRFAPTYHLDLSHITLVGHSAGGQLALWAAARTKLPHSSPLFKTNPVAVQKVITLAGINDLAAYRATGGMVCGGPSVIDQLVGASERAGHDVYKDTSPASLLPIGVTQYIISGALDPVVPPRFGRDYAAKAKAAGDKVKAIQIENAGHFELIDPQSAAWEQVRPLIVP